VLCLSHNASQERTTSTGQTSEKKLALYDCLAFPVVAFVALVAFVVIVADVVGLVIAQTGLSVDKALLIGTFVTFIGVAIGSVIA
jgi:hypothetical protein